MFFIYLILIFCRKAIDNNQSVVPLSATGTSHLQPVACGKLTAVVLCQNTVSLKLTYRYAKFVIEKFHTHTSLFQCGRKILDAVYIGKCHIIIMSHLFPFISHHPRAVVFTDLQQRAVRKILAYHVIMVV